MRATRGRSSGFDYMRLSLALCIFTLHSLSINGQSPRLLQEQPFSEAYHVLTRILVPMFFCLGGFLVAGSLERANSLLTFLGLRFLRIFPALWVDILFSALVLGPFLTALPLAAYFSS